eukprot:16429851-Heterocapsa_arctica.AAC.1
MDRAPVHVMDKSDVLTMQADCRADWNLQLPAHQRRSRQKQHEKKRGYDNKFKIKARLTIRDDYNCDQLNKEKESPAADKIAQLIIEHKAAHERQHA